MERNIKEDDIPQALERCSLIIDARSPGEFEEDHIPGAINIPMLNDEQRVEVGTLYKTDIFEARKLGAAYACDAIRKFLESPTIRNARRRDAFLIYCARGGQRSGSISTVLSSIGFPVFRLERGYKTYRTWILAGFRKPLPGPVYILHGHTGSQKTRLIQSLAEEVNVLDLEGYARHRGSVLGSLPGIPQPTQRAFETCLSRALAKLDPLKPTLIEGESRRIGRISLPGPFWEQMKAGIHLWIEVPREQRVAYILEDYDDLKDTRFLARQLNRLAPFISRKVMAGLEENMRHAGWPEFVDTLLQVHYDPLYRRTFRKGPREVLAAVGFEEARSRLLARLRGEYKPETCTVPPGVGVRESS